MDQEESPESYQLSISHYFDYVEDQIYRAIDFYVKYEYEESVDFVNFLVYPESFTGAFSVFPVLISNRVEADPDILNLFETIAPSLDRDLDPYDVDYDHREQIFMETLQKKFSEIWKGVVGDQEDDYPM